MRNTGPIKVTKLHPLFGAEVSGTDITRPLSAREFGPIRAAMYGGRGYAAESNREIACIAMIETAEALENLQDIVTTPGLDGVSRADLVAALVHGGVGVQTVTARRRLEDAFLGLVGEEHAR